MTLPPQLTLLRVFLTFLTPGLMRAPGAPAASAALGCFVVASATDWLDGFLARRWRQTSASGALLDPIADKILVLGVLAAFVWLGRAPSWLVAAIALRDVAVTATRLAAVRRGVVLSAAPEGKLKTVIQMGTIVLMFVALILDAGDPPSRRAWLASDILAGLWATLGLTLVSGAVFFWRLRTGLGRPAGPREGR
jgi:CDP-diacylglycerol--glycerol-3-phosphate 3-phosphatidyltransferase